MKPDWNCTMYMYLRFSKIFSKTLCTQYKMYVYYAFMQSRSVAKWRLAANRQKRFIERFFVVKFCTTVYRRGATHTRTLRSCMHAYDNTIAQTRAISHKLLWIYIIAFLFTLTNNVIQSMSLYILHMNKIFFADISHNSWNLYL